MVKKVKQHGAAEQAATWMGIAGNAVLFVAKIFVGFTFNSIAIISDSFNSLTDIVASAIVLISVRASYRAPDTGHPFGHARAQPLAGLVVAILTGIVGFEIIAQSAERLVGGQRIQPGILPLILLAVVMVVKTAMHIVARVTAERTGQHGTHGVGCRSPQRRAHLGRRHRRRRRVEPRLPDIRSAGGYRRGGMDHLCRFPHRPRQHQVPHGRGPPAELVQRIKAIANATEGVLGLNDVYAHYVGTAVEIEVHINVDRRLTIEEAHEIGKKVQTAIESRREISRAFIHIDPLETGPDSLHVARSRRCGLQKGFQHTCMPTVLWV